MMYYDQFRTGKRIQKLRRERYMTQEELAVRLNVSDRHLRRSEERRIFLLLTFSSRFLHFLM